MVIMTHQAYRQRIEAAKQEAMTDLLQQLVIEKLAVHDSEIPVSLCIPYAVSPRDRGMLLRFACMVMDMRPCRPWWQKLW